MTAYATEISQYIVYTFSVDDPKILLVLLIFALVLEGRR